MYKNDNLFISDETNFFMSLASFKINCWDAHVLYAIRIPLCLLNKKYLLKNKKKKKNKINTTFQNYFLLDLHKPYRTTKLFVLFSAKIQLWQSSFQREKKNFQQQRKSPNQNTQRSKRSGSPFPSLIKTWLPARSNAHTVLMTPPRGLSESTATDMRRDVYFVKVSLKLFQWPHTHRRPI